ncbi:DUF2332 domain-containing protein [Actinomadura verrucosospora]|uniref:DUF2332 domain-containing protein n=1 Tax=Actinomadura verrucosospora TaxID=46165 RepID=A0A7D3ZKY2_ACTVE|nr:DUF2332 domain-containing protein [Actinomadura verrucosospora]QKG26617.1 hypothetical protein ACTIVE_8270 [Actinomadura verrucosospora]
MRGVREELLDQARVCAAQGSPMYAELLARAADDADAGGPVADVLADRASSALALRMLGTVHRIVLEGRAPALAAHYPTAGGTADPLAAWPAFRDVLARRTAEVRAGLADAPQTNEVGRAAPLVGGLLAVAAATGLPVRLLEIGASAGLNLRADHYRLLFPGGGYGPDSPVVLPDAWRGTPPKAVPLRIAARLGCDLAPLDAAAPEGRRRLLSYVWPDQHARVARLRAALEVAARVPAAVVRAGAGDFLDGLAPEPGAVTVVWHSVMMQYLPDEEAARVHRHVEAAGAAASSGAPVAHLAFEPPGTAHITGTPLLTLRLWPGGERRVLGEAPPHGLPFTWY